MRDTPGLRRRIITRDVPPQVTPTSTRRYGLFTPRGIFKRRHWNVRRLFRQDPISPSSPVPRYLLDRTISWEGHTPWPPEVSPSLLMKRPTPSPEYDLNPSLSAVFQKPVYAFHESGGSPAAIQAPTRMYSSPESDASFSPLIEDLGSEYASSSEYDVSPSSTIRYRSPGSDRSSPSPLISRRFHRSPSPFYETDRGSASSLFDTYSGSASSFFDTDRSASPYELDETFVVSPGRTDTPAIMGPRRVITRDVPFEITPLSSRRGLFKSGRARRLFEQDPISELPWSPPLPRHRLDRTMSWEKRYGSPELSDSPLIRGPTRMYSSPDSDATPVFKRRAYMSEFSESDRSPSPAIMQSRYGYRSSESDRSRRFHSDSSPIFDTDSGDVSPYQFDISPDTSSDRSHRGTFERSDTPAIMGHGRVITRDVPLEVTPTSARRYGLFTPKGIFKKGHRRPRRLFEQESPIVSPPLPPFPRHRLNRTISWEKSYGSPELSDSPLIKGPSRMYSSPESDASSSSVFKRPAYMSEFSESDRSPSPAFRRPVNMYALSDSSPAIIEGPSVMYSTSEYDTSFSPAFKGSVFPDYDKSSSPEMIESYYMDSDSSSPSPFINREFRRPLFETPPSGYTSEFERTPDSTRISDRSFSPEYLGGQYQRGYQLDDPLNRRMWLGEMLDLSRTPDRSFSPHLARTPDRHYSPPGTPFPYIDSPSFT